MADWYVAPHVVKEGNGQIGSPWSLTYAFAGAGKQIHAGDSIFLRGGVYPALTGYDVTLSGAPGARVRFLPHADEVPLIDGTYPEFWQGDTLDTPAWEPLGPQRDGHHVYRSKRQFRDATAYSGLIDLAGLRLTLASHPDLTWLQSDVHVYRAPDPWYIGPGLTFDCRTRRICIRLDNSTKDAQVNPPRAGVRQVGDPDPNRYAIRIAPAGEYALTIRGSHLSFERLWFRGYDICWTVAADKGIWPTDLRFVDCVAEPQTRVARLGGATDVKILGGTFAGHTPSEKWWVSVADLHGGPAAPSEKSAFDLGATRNVELGPSPSTGKRMTIRQFFDGILAAGPLHDIAVHGVWFDEIWDDAWQMGKNIDNVDYFDNVHFGAGPSRDGNQKGPAGRVYIHDNVIDTTVHPLFWWRGGLPTTFPAVGESIVFSSHKRPAENEPTWPWKLYFNTVYTSKGIEHNRYVGCGQFGLNQTQQEPHEVFNNIFVVLDGKPFARDFRATTRNEIYDGNCIWSNGQWGEARRRGPYQLVYTKARSTGYPIHTLARFREDTYDDSHVYYPPGWEQAGLEVDPKFCGFYEPTACEVLKDAVDITDRVDITGQPWPGAAPYRPQRGAQLTAPMPLAAGEVTVPFLVGERHANATSLVEEAGLVPVDAGPAPPLVASQDPPPGTTVAVGSDVLLNP